MDNQKVAVVCANGIGDALLSMILSHNLSLHGAQVVTFSTLLCELQAWFPDQTIHPFPTSSEIYTTFNTVIAADHARVTEKDTFGNTLIVLKENDFDKSHTLVQNLQSLCQSRFHIPDPTQENGIVVPSHLRWRAHPKRVVIHPTSTEGRRTWPASKFHTLAHRLEKRGYEPIFCVSPEECQQWPTSPLFPKIADVAAFIYESGYLIGNNSGLGHLASLFRIPTVSLFARQSYANLWRPGWGPGRVVTPPPLLPGGRLKQKYWKALLSPSRVLHTFDKLTQL